MGRPKGKIALGRPRRIWEDNIKMGLREMSYVPGDWMVLAEDRDHGEQCYMDWRWSPEHLSPATAGFSVPYVLGLSPAGSSYSVHGRRWLQEGTSQHWKFKEVSSEGSCRFSSCVIWLMGGHKELRIVCVLTMAILNNYLWFWFIMHPLWKYSTLCRPNIVLKGYWDWIFVEFWNCHINCQNFMILILYMLVF